MIVALLLLALWLGVGAVLCVRVMRRHVDSLESKYPMAYRSFWWRRGAIAVVIGALAWPAILLFERATSR